jgi:phospho-N-acetylmuramoyl-pentapeptide-transferase
MIIDIVKVFIPATISFLIGILVTTPLTDFLYRRQMWKKKAKEVAFDGSATPIFNKLHAHGEVSVPKMGGVVIWLSVAVTVFIFWTLARLTVFDVFDKLDFFSRNQTWIPFSVLILGAIVGLVDDFLDVSGNSNQYAPGGLSLRKRLLVVSLFSFLVSLWFYFKLGDGAVGVPFVGPVPLGPWFIPFFVLVSLAVYSGGIIDGLDGLAGGIFAVIFAAYAGVAFHQQQINLAAFCAVLVGAILAFLWFNIPPARFYMSETGSMALTMTLTVVAFMADSLGNGYGVSVLPVIAFPLLVTTLSVIIQVLSKRFRQGKKVFLVAPLHHHFEAIGWPAYKVTMRYWIISVVLALIGLTIAFIA